MGFLFHWEWLLIELLVLGWAVWELVSLRRYKPPPAAERPLNQPEP